MVVFAVELLDLELVFCNSCDGNRITGLDTGTGVNWVGSRRKRESNQDLEFLRQKLDDHQTTNNRHLIFKVQSLQSTASWTVTVTVMCVSVSTPPVVS